MDALVVVFGVGTGVAAGWIACQLLVVKGLTRQIIQMRAMGFDPVPLKTKEQEEARLASDEFNRNET